MHKLLDAVYALLCRRDGVTQAPTIQQHLYRVHWIGDADEDFEDGEGTVWAFSPEDAKSRIEQERGREIFVYKIKALKSRPFASQRVDEPLASV